MSSEEKKNSEFRFPSDLADKGNQMVEAYYKLYCLENILRLFMEKIAKDCYGKNYWDKLTIKTEVQKNINSRKKDEKQYKWLSLRGNSNFFYVDFDDLRKIIISNWDLYEDTFKDQQWIIDKLKDLYKIRNLIAHNSYIKDTEQKALEVYAELIYNQIGVKFVSKYPIKNIIKKQKKRPKRVNNYKDFQELVINQDFRRIILDWFLYEYFFPKIAFEKQNFDLKDGGKVVGASYRFNDSAIQFKVEGRNFNCIVRNKDGITANSTDDNFNEIARQFFETIKDDVEEY